MFVYFLFIVLSRLGRLQNVECCGGGAEWWIGKLWKDVACAV